MEAPKRVFIECPYYLTRSHLALRILHNWVKKDALWPQKVQAVQLALFIPLNEVLKGNLHSYITKELMTKSSTNFFSNSLTWNILESLGSSLLLIIDACDIAPWRLSNKSKNICDDILNLFEGRLLSESRLIILGNFTLLDLFRFFFYIYI